MALNTELHDVDGSHRARTSTAVEADIDRLVSQLNADGNDISNIGTLDTDSLAIGDAKTVEPADGISGIQTELDGAGAGDVIRLLPGDYSGTSGLRWPATDEITLSGPTSARLKPTIEDEPIIDVKAVDSRDCVVEGVTLDGTNQTTANASAAFQDGTARAWGLAFDSQTTTDHDMSGWEIRSVTTDSIRKTSIGAFLESGDVDLDLRIHDWTDRNRRAFEAFHAHGGLSHSVAITGSDFLSEQDTPNIGATIRHPSVVAGCRFNGCVDQHILGNGGGPLVCGLVTVRNAAGDLAMFQSWDGDREHWGPIAVDGAPNNAVFQFKSGGATLDGFTAHNCTGNVIDFRSSNNVVRNASITGGGTIAQNSGSGNRFQGYVGGSVTNSLPSSVVQNGISVESANAETPSAAAHQTGDVVDFTDSGDGSGTGTYQLRPDGTWLQLA